MKILRVLKRRVVAWSAAVVLGVCAVAFLAFAAYLELAAFVAPGTAALLTGGILLLLAVLTVLVFGRSPPSRRRRLGGHEPADELEAYLAERTDPVLSGLLRRYPERALAATLLLGIAAGYSSSVRRVLRDLYASTDRADD
jgi:hypothetical protein